MKLCEAAAMDAAHYGNWEDSALHVPPCNELAEQEINGYELCPGCYEALAVLGMFGRTIKQRRENRWIVLNWKIGQAMIGAAKTLLVFCLLVAAAHLILGLNDKDALIYAVSLCGMWVWLNAK